MFDVLTDDILAMKNSFDLPLCLIGDLNSRTGNLDDSIIIEHSVINSCGIDDFAQELFGLDPNNINQFLAEERNNKDTTVNCNGELLIEFCKANNLRIVNGRCGNDKGRSDFTFNSQNGSSTIDYCIVSPNFCPHISNFEVDILDKGLSDFHSPIILILKLTMIE